MRVNENGGTNRPAASAASAIAGGYAWYTTIVAASKSARIWRSTGIGPPSFEMV